MRHPGALAIIAAAILALAAESVVAQRTLRVPGQDPTIQRALDAAADDDTIVVAPGRYVETLRFPPQVGGLTLVSAAGPFRTTIDGAKATVAVVHTFWGADATIDGFTVTNGAAGGMQLWNRMTVQNCIVTGCLGTGITVGDAAVIRDNIIERNAGADGGGIHFAASRVGLTATGNLIADNVATGKGGGIYADSSHVRLYANVIVRNRAGTDGGGIRNDNGSNLELRSNVIAMNAAGRDGGGLSMTYVVDMEDSTILGNTAARNGGGFALEGAGITTRIGDMIVWGNAAQNGPSAYVTGGSSNPTTLWVYNSIVDNGQASVALGPNGYVYWGFGNGSVDPRVVDPVFGDWHLGARSPAIDTAVDPPAYPYDADGDMRVMGRDMDLGGDEFPQQLSSARLYVIGKAAPSSTIRIGLVAPPRSTPPVILGGSLAPSLRSPPQPIPGIGTLHLADPIGVIALPNIDADGTAALVLPIPALFPPTVLHLQALVGNRLTNAVTVWIR